MTSDRQTDRQLTWGSPGEPRGAEAEETREPPGSSLVPREACARAWPGLGLRPLDLELFLGMAQEPEMAPT